MTLRWQVVGESRPSHVCHGMTACWNLYPLPPERGVAVPR
jgi:hypothetical protein